MNSKDGCDIPHVGCTPIPNYPRQSLDRILYAVNSFQILRWFLDMLLGAKKPFAEKAWAFPLGHQRVA